MRILFLCHRFPEPPEGGGKIRALQMVRHLAERGHDVTLCSLTRSAAERRGAERMRELCRVEAVDVGEWTQAVRMALTLPTARPFSFGYFHSPRLAARVRALLEHEPWDLIIAHCSSMGDYVAHAAGVPKIMDFADMDSQKWLDYARHKRFPASAIYGLEGRKLERQERRLARAFDLCTTISRNELETLEGFGTGAAADWFPNGVDLDYFSPPEDGYDADLICFVGRMDYFPNAQAMTWFCEAVWPALRHRRPSLKLRIVGADPPRAVRRLGELEGVEVKGSVPDVRPYVASAALTVAPLRIARGLQNKVLESMAMGVPVVTGAHVASGLGPSGDMPIVLAAGTSEYVEEIARILESADERARLSSASRAFVEQRFSWRTAMEKLDRIIERIVQDRRARFDSIETGDSRQAAL